MFVEVYGTGPFVRGAIQGLGRQRLDPSAGS
jgi:hypothetical protein